MKRSWLGFAFDAVADDEDTAGMLGLDVTQFKLIAFAIGTSLAGLAGGLNYCCYIFIYGFWTL